MRQHRTTSVVKCHSYAQKICRPALVAPSLQTGVSTILARHIGHVCSRLNQADTQSSQNMCWTDHTQGETITDHRNERTAPSKTKDRMSSVSLLMGLQSNSGTADARAAVTWPSTEVAARLSPLPNCSFMYQSFNSRIFELGDCFVAQSSPGFAILSDVTQGHTCTITDHTQTHWTRLLTVEPGRHTVFTEYVLDRPHTGRDNYRPHTHNHGPHMDILSALQL